MSLLERKLSQKKEFIAFHPPGEEGKIENIPKNQHNFHDWQQYINGTFGELSQRTYLACLNQCNYDLSMMGGRKAPINDHAEIYCSHDCSIRWINPFNRYTQLANSKSEKDFEKCLKADNQVEIEPKDLLECKRVKFFSYLDSVLDYEQEYLKLALEKYS